MYRLRAGCARTLADSYTSPPSRYRTNNRKLATNRRKAGGVESPRVTRGTGGTISPPRPRFEPPQQFDIIEERPARAAADGVPALAAQNDPRVAERGPGRVEAAPRLKRWRQCGPPVEARRVADDGPAPRQRRDGIFEIIASAWSSRSASPLGAATASMNAPPRPPPEDATTTAAVVSRYVRRRIRGAAIRHNCAERRAVARRGRLSGRSRCRPMQPASFLAAMHTERRGRSRSRSSLQRSRRLQPRYCAAGGALLVTQIGRARSRCDVGMVFRVFNSQCLGRKRRGRLAPTIAIDFS